MKARSVIFSTLLIAVSLTAAWLLVFQPVPHVSGRFRHEAYVWQRAWTEPVRKVVFHQATNFSALCMLKAEIAWKDKRPHVARVPLDYPFLSKVISKAALPTGNAELPVNQDAQQRAPTVGIALRIGPYSGPFTTNDPITLFLVALASSLVAEARSNHFNLGELQIDFDCAESKLYGYRVWVETIQRSVAPLPVTITALPSWLDSQGFKRLVAVATNYVLQVHSVERPKDIHASFTLCDPRAARRAVERAGRIGVPFRVALPTYGYTLAFDSSGKFIGFSAEGPRPNWPTNARLQEIRSDPIELGMLVKQWTTSRPAAMRGVIWYRLPVSTDNLNWRWPTLREIIDPPVPH